MPDIPWQVERAWRKAGGRAAPRGGRHRPAAAAAAAARASPCPRRTHPPATWPRPCPPAHSNPPLQDYRQGYRHDVWSMAWAMFAVSLASLPLALMMAKCGAGSTTAWFTYARSLTACAPRCAPAALCQPCASLLLTRCAPPTQGRGGSRGAAGGEAAAGCFRGAGQGRLAGRLSRCCVRQRQLCWVAQGCCGATRTYPPHLALTYLPASWNVPPTLVHLTSAVHLTPKLNHTSLPHPKTQPHHSFLTCSTPRVHCWL